MQGPDGVGKKGVIPASHTMIYTQVPPPTLVGDGNFESPSLKMGKLIFMWALVSVHHLLCWECWEPSNWSDCDDTNKAVNTELPISFKSAILKK